MIIRIFFCLDAMNSISFGLSGKVEKKKNRKALKNLPQKPYLCTMKEDSISITDSKLKYR